MEVFRLNDIQARELVPGGKVKFAHSDTMTVAFWTFEADSVLPEHAHPHEQILNVMKGEIEFTIDGETQKVRAPTVLECISENSYNTRDTISLRI